MGRKELCVLTIFGHCETRDRAEQTMIEACSLRYDPQRADSAGGGQRLVTVVLAPLLFFLLKSREEGRRRQFEVRYAEYKKCLQALEQIAAVARIDFKQAYTGIAASALKEALAEADEDYGPRLQKGLDELSGRLRDSFAGAAGELHGLGLACSAELLTTVNEFVKLQRELVEESIAVI
ncbi:MAG TPA: hypothetical protein VNH80_03320, partial [Burkholderiales bacterium]|nr:hypothetical protein [Burkholderiales bacterium]